MWHDPWDSAAFHGGALLRAAAGARGVFPLRVGEKSCGSEGETELDVFGATVLYRWQCELQKVWRAFGKFQGPDVMARASARMGLICEARAAPGFSRSCGDALRRRGPQRPLLVASEKARPHRVRSRILR